MNNPHKLNQGLKAHHKSLLAYLLFSLTVFLIWLMLCDAIPQGIIAFTLLALAPIAIFFDVFRYSYLKGRSLERMRELESYLNEPCRLFKETSSQNSIMNDWTQRLHPAKIIWDNSKIYAHADTVTNEIRISEKWLYSISNAQKRYFLIRWCKYMLFFHNHSFSPDYIFIEADRYAMANCAGKGYDLKKIYLFSIEAFRYPHTMTSARIDRLKKIVYRSEYYV